MARRIFTAAAIASVLALTGAASSQAGRYHVYSCRTPSGQSAPTDGWSGSLAPGGAFDDYTINSCGEGGALVAALGDATVHAANVDRATWGFTAPNDTTLASAELWRAGDTDGGAVINTSYEFSMAGPAITSVFDECLYVIGCMGEGDLGRALAEANRVAVPSQNLGPTLFVSALCGEVVSYQCPAGKGDANAYAAAIYLFAADLTLEENEAPHVSNVSGELASAPVIRGQSDLTFEATDSGSGVEAAVFQVNGPTIQRTTVDTNGGRCQDVGQTTDGAQAFLYTQPCSKSVSVDVPFDTTKVDNGPHRLIVRVADAAGNQAPVIDRTVTIANPPPPGSPNGANASTQATMWLHWLNAGKKTTVTSRFGAKRRITGRLMGPGGVPIGGAQIDLSVTPSYAGARTTHINKVRTAADGTFGMVVAGSFSRTLQFAYRAHVGDTQAAVAHTLSLKVRPAIALRVSPHSTSVGHRIHFAGQLSGAPIPRGGKQLVLEARSPGSRWIEFKVVRTDARGRFHASYRFRFAGPADYRFRARSEPESDFPFAGGSSNSVAVHER
ncbi:MAG: hypothetical protein ACYDHT_06170 [Solirubrobacteraceae bacterium]